MFLLYDIFMIINSILRFFGKGINYKVFEVPFLLTTDSLFLSLCIVSIVFALGGFLLNFMNLGRSGDNPYGRRRVLQRLFYYSIRSISSIISLILFIIVAQKVKNLLNIILCVIAIILIIIVIVIIGKLIYKLIKLIINKIHGI